MRAFWVIHSKFWPLNSFGYQNSNFKREICIIFKISMEICEIVKKISREVSKIIPISKDCWIIGEPWLCAPRLMKVQSSPWPLRDWFIPLIILFLLSFLGPQDIKEVLLLKKHAKKGGKKAKQFENKLVRRITKLKGLWPNLWNFPIQVLWKDVTSIQTL